MWAEEAGECYVQYMKEDHFLHFLLFTGSYRSPNKTDKYGSFCIAKYRTVKLLNTYSIFCVKLIV